MLLSLKDFQARFPIKTTTISGSSWAWRDTDPNSRRLPLVFLPGAGGTGDVFYRTASKLMNSRRVIVMHYPALAQTDELTDGLLGLFSELGLRDVDIAGSSLGGYLSQSVASRAPGLVRRVLFGNSFYDASWLQRKVDRDQLLATDSDQHLANTLANLKALPEDGEAQRDFKATMLALTGSQQSGDMAKASLAAVLGARPLPPVDLPDHAMAVLDCEDDPVVDLETRLAIRERYQKSPQFTLVTGGHYPCLLNPDFYEKAIQVHFGKE